jgi:hypothetical protein
MKHLGKIEKWELINPNIDQAIGCDEFGQNGLGEFLQDKSHIKL